MMSSSTRRTRVAELSDRKSRFVGNCISRCRGFSLIEIALALGLASFVLVALIGLMSVGLEAGKAAREDTIIASVIRDVLARVKSEPFAALAPGSTKKFSYTYEGNHIESGGAETPYFECEVAFAVSSLSSPELQAHSVDVLFNCSWPAQSSSPYEESFATTIASY